MLRKVALAALSLSLVAVVAVAGDAKSASGTVKSVATNSFVVTDSGGKDWTFDVDKTTLVVVRGGSHKMDAVKADGKLPTLAEFVAAKQVVRVEYAEQGEKLLAKEVRVKSGEAR